MQPLPIDARLGDVLNALETHRSAVLVAPPGAGKTTRVPPALLASGLVSPRHPEILLLQPRRIAARAAAARIAAEQGWIVGREVGYQVRFERRVGPGTLLKVLTEGILTRQLLADPFLDRVGAVILDEFHERSLHTDLALALLREVRETVREDLLVVVMSATLAADPVAEFLGGCPIVSVEGRPFPVTIEHALPAGREPMPEQVARVLDRLRRESDDQGDILVFLPGLEEIRRCARAVSDLAAREGWLVLPLHGRLTTAEQDRALAPADRRKLILATNVAETSLTIEGVRTVLDTGLARFARYDPNRGLERLELGRISRASAAQRAGRAGRTGPGRCVRLWSVRDERGMPEFDTPEIRRVDLAATALALHAWGYTDPTRFPWFESPPTEALEGAEQTLRMLQALDPHSGAITDLGRDLLALPVHPRIGRLLRASAEVGLLRAGATIAALLSEKDILATRIETDRRPRGPTRHGDSDVLDRLDRLDEVERSRFALQFREQGLDLGAARGVARVRDELLRLTRRWRGSVPPADEAENDVLLRRLLLLAYPDRVARRRARDPSAAVMVGGRGVRLDPASVVRDGEFFLVIDLHDERRGGVREARVRLASTIEPGWLEGYFPEAIRRDRAVRYDPARDRVVAITTVWYRDLPLREDPHGAVSPEQVVPVLVEAFQGRAAEIVRGDETAAAWLDRLACLRAWRPDLELPDFSPEVLAEVLADGCASCQGEADLRRRAWVLLLEARLSYSQRRALAELAPEALTVPSGSRIRLTYEPGRPPILAARLQELFGWSETPRIAGGRVAVLLHLLGPNFRPVQITDDLESFWNHTFPQVRKDLRARYPRHAWPDDPWTARPEAKGGRRRP